MLSKLILGVLAASTAAVNVKTEERTLIHPERREQLNKIKAMSSRDAICKSVFQTIFTDIVQRCNDSVAGDKVRS